MLIALKIKAAALGIAVSAPLLATAFTPYSPPRPDEAVALAPALFSYRDAGDFSRGGQPALGPLHEVRADKLLIMRNQVTAGEYAQCMAEGACPKLALPVGRQDVPMVGVSWHDAKAYAAWISRKTRMSYRLPTDEEWTFAAAERARDETLPLVNPADPAQAWIARYEAEAARGRSAIAAPQPTGTFGINSKGLADMAGNVWEWTNSCFNRFSLDGNEEHITTVNCGVRVVEGAHRTYMTDFIRNPKSGGCAAGVPPSNLGFRLVIAPPASVVANAFRTMSERLFHRT